MLICLIDEMEAPNTKEKDQKYKGSASKADTEDSTILVSLWWHRSFV